MNCGIYWIRNKINSKLYIGSSVNISKRWYEHIRRLNKGNHDSPHLQASWKLYGQDNFEFEVILECAPSMVRWYEQQFLDEWSPEYNYSKSAGGFLPGHSHSAVTLEKMSNSRKGKRYLSDLQYTELGKKQTGENNPSAKLTKDDVCSIWVMLRAGVPQRKIGTIYGVTQAMINRINTGKAWSSVTSFLGGN